MNHSRWSQVSTQGLGRVEGSAPQGGDLKASLINSPILIKLETGEWLRVTTVMVYNIHVLEDVLALSLSVPAQV